MCFVRPRVFVNQTRPYQRTSWSSWSWGRIERQVEVEVA